MMACARQSSRDPAADSPGRTCDNGNGLLDGATS